MLDHGWPLAYLYGSFKMRNQTKTILCHEEIWKSFYTIWTMVITIINTSSLRIELFSPSFWARTKSKLQLKLIPERRPRDGTPHEYRDKSSGPSVPTLINMIARINQGVRRGHSLITTIHFRSLVCMCFSQYHCCKSWVWIMWLMAPLELDLCCKIILPISNLSHQSNVSCLWCMGGQWCIGSCQNWTKNIMN